MTQKSPFLVYENFLSPLSCQEIVDKIELLSPNVDEDGKFLPEITHNSESEAYIFERLQSIIPNVMDHYDMEYRATETMSFESFPEGTESELGCGNSRYVRKKWFRNKERDVTGVLFLTNYNDTADFDPEFEVYGGKLEFPQHHFGFNPQRGTLVLFPSVPNFIFATSKVNAGQLHQVKFHISTKIPLLYKPEDYPGDYTTWFK